MKSEYSILVSALAHVLLHLGFLSQHGWGGTAVSLCCGRATIDWLQEQVRAPSDFWNLQPKPSLWGSLKGKSQKGLRKRFVSSSVFWHLHSPRYSKPHSLRVSHILLVLKHLTTRKLPGESSSTDVYGPQSKHLGRAMENSPGEVASRWWIET